MLELLNGYEIDIKLCAINCCKFVQLNIVFEYRMNEKIHNEIHNIINVLFIRLDVV
jgi:hypothetical protein